MILDDDGPNENCDYLINTSQIPSLGLVSSKHLENLPHNSGELNYYFWIMIWMQIFQNTPTNWS